MGPSRAFFAHMLLDTAAVCMLVAGDVTKVAVLAAVEMTLSVLTVRVLCCREGARNDWRA